MSRERSRAIFARAQELMPGGVNSPARAFGGVGGEPIVVESGKGSALFDVDGNRYIDYIGSWGPLILGHANPVVLAAVRDALGKGTSFGAPTEAESKLADLIISAVPSIEMVRLVCSGTEATMSAIRLARGFTGRDIIVKFSGNYHGHVDSLLVAAGSSAATLGVPDSPGVTAGTSKDTLILPYNDTGAVLSGFEQHGDRIAAVIMEPIAGNMGCVPATTEFVRTVRDVTKSHNSLLIFDEVITGFRVGFGGAQELLGISPDLTTLGKIVGGGFPIGAYGGRSDIMRHVLPAGRVFQAGTLSGNPVATAAGIATLEFLRDQSPYAQLEELASIFGDGLMQAAADAGVPAYVSRVGSMLTLFFSPEPVMDWETAKRADTRRFARFFWGMIDRGVYLPCSQFEAMFVSIAHSKQDISTTVDAAREVLARP
jgi:glutamate-1-semialdehyde 2,1-aminomutase